MHVFFSVLKVIVNINIKQKVIHELVTAWQEANLIISVKLTEPGFIKRAL